MRHSSANAKGFTLIEILLSITLMGMMATTVIVALNPAKQLSNARNAQRKSDIVNILAALNQYVIEHAGTYPGSITNTPTYICRTGKSISDCTGLIDLRVLTDLDAYMSALPVDPLASTTVSTGYTVYLNDLNGNALTVAAPAAESGITISLTQ